ncbi:MAG: ATP-dependent protease subunit HslV [Acidobacteria bacterium]|jgi:ATP-dependent HslUV protease subunit HslV|nr:ATP-dependent protease subunit HslV [Acidobacteriota bacterium]
MRVTSTTVVAVRRAGRVAMAADGQVTLDRTIVKEGARKVRRLADGRILAGFAGGAADAFALLQRFEERLEQHGGRLERAAIELARDWRQDRALRRLEALLLVADREHTLLLSGTGDLIEPDDGVIAIGSGGSAALAAARALVQHTELAADEIAIAALQTAASIDIYTNERIVCETLGD